MSIQERIMRVAIEIFILLFYLTWWLLLAEWLGLNADGVLIIAGLAYVNARISWEKFK